MVRCWTGFGIWRGLERNTISMLKRYIFCVNSSISDFKLFIWCGFGYINLIINTNYPQRCLTRSCWRGCRLDSPPVGRPGRNAGWKILQIFWLFRCCSYICTGLSLSRPTLHPVYLCHHQDYGHYVTELEEAVSETGAMASFVVPEGLSERTVTPAMTMIHRMSSISEERRVKRHTLM